MSKTGATPETLTVPLLRAQPTPGTLEWLRHEERLLDEEGRPLWLEHPKYGRRVDVVALPLIERADVIFDPYDLDDGSNGRPRLGLVVSQPVNIVGFPFGITAGGAVATWVRGAVASEPTLDFDDLPSFLIDARTRPGQSGSPVIAHVRRGEATVTSDGVGTVFGGPVTELLGVYSGRINETSDLGIVWKLSAIREIIDAGRIGNNDLRDSAAEPIVRDGGVP